MSFLTSSPMARERGRNISHAGWWHQTRKAGHYWRAGLPSRGTGSCCQNGPCAVQHGGMPSPAPGISEPQAGVQSRHGLPGQQLCRKSPVILGDSEHTLELAADTLGLEAFGTAGTGTTEYGICSLISSRLYALEKIAVIYLCLLKCIFILSVNLHLSW